MQTGATGQQQLALRIIVQWFARLEGMMQQIMAAVSGADVTSIRLLTAGLTCIEKRDALLNLLQRRAVPHNQIEQVQDYLLVLRTSASLQNNIGGGTRDFIADGDPVGYTLEDLQAISRKLAASYGGLHQYAVAMGLIPSQTK